MWCLSVMWCVVRNSLDVPRTLNRTGDLAFSVAAPRLWNTLIKTFQMQKLYIILRLGYIIAQYRKYRYFQC